MKILRDGNTEFFVQTERDILEERRAAPTLEKRLELEEAQELITGMQERPAPPPRRPRWLPASWSKE